MRAPLLHLVGDDADRVSDADGAPTETATHTLAHTMYTTQEVSGRVAKSVSGMTWALGFLLSHKSVLGVAPRAGGTCVAGTLPCGKG